MTTFKKPKTHIGHEAVVCLFFLELWYSSFPVCNVVPEQSQTDDHKGHQPPALRRAGLSQWNAILVEGVLTGRTMQPELQCLQMSHTFLLNSPQPSRKTNKCIQAGRSLGPYINKSVLSEGLLGLFSAPAWTHGYPVNYPLQWKRTFTLHRTKDKKFTVQGQLLWISLSVHLYFPPKPCFKRQVYLTRYLRTHSETHQATRLQVTHPLSLSERVPWSAGRAEGRRPSLQSSCDTCDKFAVGKPHKAPSS